MTNANSAEARARSHHEQLKSDFRIVFEAYEEQKLRLDRLGRLAERGHQRKESLTERISERRKRWREELARHYRKRQPVEGQQPAVKPVPRKLFDAVPSIAGTRIVLDRIVDADADALRDLIGNPNVQRYEPTYLFEKQRDDVHETIRLLYGDLFESRESLILAIRMRDTGELAGIAEFYGLRDSLHKVSIGYRLRERWWGKGIATEAARLMVGYLYGETDIEIITASTMVENKASAHVLEKVGFIRTARAVEEDWGFPEPTIVDKWFC